MASKLLKSVVSKHGTSYYKQFLKKNKKYIQKPATAEKCNELSKQLLYTRLASIPGRTKLLWKEVANVKGFWTDLTIKDAGIGAVGLKYFAWYCVVNLLEDTKPKQRNKSNYP